MTDREKLIELLGEDTCHRDGCYDCDYDGDRNACIEYLKNSMADHLLANGVTFTPSIPGPSEADPNIMELCFHNGERHMKEKILKMLVGYSRASGNTFGPVYEHIISGVEKL